MNSHTPTLTEAVDFAFRSMLSEIHTAIPGSINRYDYTKQQADVKPLLKREFPNGTVLAMPVITNVPVTFPRTKDALLHFPVAKGDTVLLVFSERSIDTWLEKGGEVEPKDPRMFNLSDAFAIVGLYPFSDVSPARNNDDCSLIFKDERITIKANGDIELGVAGLKRLITEEFKALFNDHVHSGIGLSGTTVCPAGTGTCTITLGDVIKTVTPLTDSHLTDKVKAE